MLQKGGPILTGHPNSIMLYLQRQRLLRKQVSKTGNEGVCSVVDGGCLPLWGTQGRPRQGGQGTSRSLRPKGEALT